MTPTPSHVATDELIETLERLEKEATPRPWAAKRIDYEEYGIDVSFEINAPRKSPVLQTTMTERHEVASVRADWANCELVTALRNHLPALISALKESRRMRTELERWMVASVERHSAGGIMEQVGLWCQGCDEEAPSLAALKHKSTCVLAALQPQGEK